MKRYRGILILGIGLLVFFIAALIFCFSYYYNYSHFGKEIEKYLDYTYVEDDMLTVQYEGRNYYIGADSIGEITMVVMRGGIISRERKFFNKGDNYEDKPRMVLKYKEATVTLIDLTEGDVDNTFMIYDIADGGTYYYMLHKLNAFQNVLKCLRVIKSM